MRYFDKQENIDKLFDECDKWRGASFSANRIRKYTKADCGRLVGEVYKAIGVFKRSLRYDTVPPRWYFHRNEEHVLRQLDNAIKNHVSDGYKIRKANNSKVRIGDILFFSTTKKNVSNHVGIYIGENMFFNATEGAGVTRGIYSRYKKYLTNIYRIYICQAQQQQ